MNKNTIYLYMIYSITINEEYLYTNKYQNKLYFQHDNIIVENNSGL